MISIVIPLYNKEKQIKDTLHSVFNQTFQNFEIVIVDDGSTDGSVNEVGKINDPRIRLFHQENQGVSAARNRGIAEAKYDYIALLDADDEWKSVYLETQMRLIRDYPECSVFACNYEFRNEKGIVTPTIINKLPFGGTNGILDNYFEVASCSHPPICSISIVAKKECFSSVGRFPVGVKSGEDLLTWARLAVRYKIAYNREALAVFCIDRDFYDGEQLVRLPNEPDVVGKELYSLSVSNKAKYINKYIALWHKMRAHVYLEKGMRKKAWHEIKYSAKYNFTWKICVFFVLLLFPVNMIKKLLR